MTLSITAQQRCLLPWIKSQRKSCRSARAGTATPEFLSFLQHVDGSVPDNLDIHLMIDHYCTHQHGKVKKWLAGRPRFHLHFTPTHASWINRVERCFGIIAWKAIRRGSFHNVEEPARKINAFVEDDNSEVRSFAWVGTGESILGKIEGLCKATSRTLH